MYEIDIDRFVNLTSMNKGWYVEHIYHYASEPIVPLILTPGCVTFRLTRIDDFADKTEGKTIENYYKKALEKLHEEKTLSDHLFELFSQIKPPKNYSFPFSSDSLTLFAPEIAVPYVICFSKDASSPDMFKNYLKETERGAAIEFNRHLLSVHHLLVTKTKYSGNGFKLLLKNVLYGEENVDELVCYIKELLSCVNVGITEEIFRNYIVFAIETKLSAMQYCSKQAKYKYENEVRLILLVAEKGHNSVDPLSCFCLREENNRHYITAKFHRCVFSNLYPSPAMEHDIDSLKEIIRNNGHRI